MYIIFFDTETNGLPKNYKASYNDLKNWPRIIQLAWQMYDFETKELLQQGCELVKPDKWKIPKEKFWIDNEYTTEKNTELGIPMKQQLDVMAGALSMCDVLVAHNIAFDAPILAAEFIRYGVKSGKRPAKICTMNSSTKFCAIPHAKGSGLKWPKLQELHKKLFDCEFDGAHDALADVSATARCFFELVRLKIINLPEWPAAV